MDWSRISEWVGVPVAKLKARFSKKQESRIATLEERMQQQTKELDRVTAELREVVERRKVVFDKIREYEESAERALRDKDEATARAMLVKKQDWVRIAEEGKKESAAWLGAIRVVRDELAATRAEADEVLREAGVEPEPEQPRADDGTPKVRVKV